MKISILIFLLVSTSIFDQESLHFFDYFSVEEMILGEWELEKTIMVDRDSVHYDLLPTSKNHCALMRSPLLFLEILWNIVDIGK